jgi:AmmeMemoRadiSam system protein A/AmmeMemoRadiSam system protein B
MNREYGLTDALVKNYLDAVTTTDGVPLSLVIPEDVGAHTYPEIAAAFKQLEGQLLDLAILISSSPSKSIQIQAKGVVNTPLGELEVDQQAARALMKQLPESQPLKVSRDNTAKPAQAKIDIQAAFLKQLAPFTKVLPVLVPGSNLEQGRQLGRLLAELLREKQAVVIAQTDLDSTLLAALEFNDPDVFDRTAGLVNENPSRETDRGAFSAAGAAAALQYAVNCGGNTVSVLDQSGRGGQHQAAVMLWNYQPPELTPDQESKLMALAKQGIESYVVSGAIPDTRSSDPVLSRKAGVFVTLRIGGLLRGCIGHMTAEKPIIQAVQEMAVAAATSDPRFPPLSREELDRITIKVAILSPMQRIGYQQVEVGKHGLLISAHGRRGVLLPEVPTDRGWDRETFLENLCYKAGLPGDTWRQNPTLYAFTSVVFGNEG